jgi:hypothetical protein
MYTCNVVLASILFSNSTSSDILRGKEDFSLCKTGFPPKSTNTFIELMVLMDLKLACRSTENRGEEVDS